MWMTYKLGSPQFQDYEDRRYKIHQVARPRLMSSRARILIVCTVLETTCIVERAVHVAADPKNEILSEANQSITLMAHRDLGHKHSCWVLMELTSLNYPEEILNLFRTLDLANCATLQTWSKSTLFFTLVVISPRDGHIDLGFAGESRLRTLDTICSNSSVNTKLQQT
jgi:hypothetical protein